MADDRPFDPERLRPPEYISEPDPRTVRSVTWDSTGKVRPLDVRDYYVSVSQLVLHKCVPEKVVIQFETVKNLYLYSWFIYRFFPIAEHQAFACLEFALRTRYEPKAERSSGLKSLLEQAVKRGDIKNEGFERWHEGVWKRARNRYDFQVFKEMREKNLDTIMVDYSNIEITDQDRNWDYIQTLLDYLPNIRNDYAHGSASLDNQVLGTIQIVSEIINQVFKSVPV